jgi:hypothetical protein
MSAGTPACAILALTTARMQSEDVGPGLLLLRVADGHSRARRNQVPRSRPSQPIRLLHPQHSGGQVSAAPSRSDRCGERGRAIAARCSWLAALEAHVDADRDGITDGRVPGLYFWVDLLCMSQHGEWSNLQPPWYACCARKARTAQRRACALSPSVHGALCLNAPPIDSFAAVTPRRFVGPLSSAIGRIGHTLLVRASLPPRLHRRLRPEGEGRSPECAARPLRLQLWDLADADQSVGPLSRTWFAPARTHEAANSCCCRERGGSRGVRPQRRRGRFQVPLGALLHCPDGDSPQLHLHPRRAHSLPRQSEPCRLAFKGPDDAWRACKAHLCHCVARNARCHIAGQRMLHRERGALRSEDAA